MSIDTDRLDYVFSHATSCPVIAESSGRMANAALMEGVAAQARVYMGTWWFYVTGRVQDKARVTVGLRRDAILLDSENKRVPIDSMRGGAVHIMQERSDRRGRRPE